VQYPLAISVARPQVRLVPDISLKSDIEQPESGQLIKNVSDLWVNAPAVHDEAGFLSLA
jgi:hypothetical protein